MPASHNWVNVAAESLVGELGAGPALHAVQRLLQAPGANASVYETLKRLEAAVENEDDGSEVLQMTYRVPSEAGPAHAQHVADAAGAALLQAGADPDRVTWYVP